MADADDAPIVHTKADIVRVREEIEMRQEHIHAEAASGVAAMLEWADLSVDEAADDKPPERFVERYGDEARRVFNIAKAAMLPASDAPAGLKLTVDIYRGALAAAARRQEGSGTKVAMLVQLKDEPVPDSIVVKGGK